MFDFLCYSSSDSYLPKKEQGPIAFLRVIHASPACRRTDVYSNGHPIAKNLSFKKFTPYFWIPAGPHVMEVFQTGKKLYLCSKNEVTAEQDQVYTGVITGHKDKAEFLLIPDPKVQIGEDASKLRFVNLSPDTVFDMSGPEGQVLFREIGYRGIPGYVSITPGKHTLKVSNAEKPGSVLTLPDVELKGGWNYTFYTMGLNHGKPGLQAIVPIDGSTYIVPPRHE